MKGVLDYSGLRTGVDDFFPVQAKHVSRDDCPKPQCNQGAPQNAKGGGKIVVSPEW
jgi:hypothetical protein